MKLLITESKLVNIVSKFIGELYELSMPGGNETYFLDNNETVVFIYNDYSEELTVNTEVVHNVSTQLGIPYKDLKPILKNVAQQLTGKQTSDLRFFN
jgi:hypothetical protein